MKNVRAGIYIPTTDLEAGYLHNSKVSGKVSIKQQDNRTLREIRAEAERHAIEYTLRSTRYNISETARRLGVSRPTIYSLIKKYRIPAEKQ